MKYFLAKTDPDTYAIDDFIKEKVTLWDGVHNHQAINVIKKMKPGDRVFIYHSMSEKAILGLAEVLEDPFLNTDDPRFSWAVKLGFIKKTNPITLKDIKAEPSLAEFKLVRHTRLSTMEVDEPALSWILSRI